MEFSWKTYREIAEIQQEITKLFQDLTVLDSEGLLDSGYYTSPPVDVYENQEYIVIEIEMPALNS